MGKQDVGRVQIISQLRHLDVDAPDGFYELMPGISIVVGEHIKAAYLTEELKVSIGMIEFSHLEGSNHLLVGEMPASWFGKKVLPQAMLYAWLNFVDWLIKDSWLIKDNSIVCEAAFLKFSIDDQVVWSSNGLFSLLTMADGHVAHSVTFSVAELKQWNETCDKVRDMVFSKQGIMGMQVSDKEYTRFARFYHFVDTSRRTKYPAIKISHCCSALESLFSTDTTELSHKLAERIAFLMANYGGDAEEVYKFIRDCYAVRSAVTHGSAVPSKLARSVEALSVRMLNVLRKIVFILAEDDELLKIMNGNNEGVEKYFRSLIFSRAPQAEQQSPTS